VSGFIQEARQKEAEDVDARACAAVFAGAGYERIVPQVLQPADVFLDRLGDEVRSRIYVLTDPGGAELCLRPEITIPACLLYLQSSPDPAALARLYYDGPIYRYATPGSGRRIEERQLGIECLGAADKDAAETEVLALCLRALRAAGGRLAGPMAWPADKTFFAARALCAHPAAPSRRG
jgi:ATP phosphoribosyltransferase regulatory subunit